MELNKKLLDANISTYIDSSDKSFGFKLAEAEVNGIPVRIEVGARDLEKGIITIVRRDTREKIEVSKDVDIVKYVSELLDTIQNDMYKRALKRRDELTFEATNLKEMEDILRISL